MPLSIDSIGNFLKNHYFWLVPLLLLIVGAIIATVLKVNAEQKKDKTQEKVANIAIVLAVGVPALTLIGLILAKYFIADKHTDQTPTFNNDGVASWMPIS